MNNNEVLKKIQAILKADNSKLIEIFALSDTKVTPGEIADWLKSQEEESYSALSDDRLVTFLNALIYFKRGEEGTNPSRSADTTLSNNLVLKKIRIAFKLEEKDLTSILQNVGSTSTSKVWSCYFRSPEHKHYRECPDSFLLSILQGIKSPAS